MATSDIPQLQLPDYKNVNYWRSGGMGYIFRGQSVKTGDEVVIKLPQLHRPSKDEQKLSSSELQADMQTFHSINTSFVLEKLIAPVLKNEHILRAIDRNFYKEYPYLVYEYISTGSLQDLLVDQQPWLAESWSLLAIADVVVQAAEGLFYLHNLNPPIVHMDVKPSNFLWRPSHPTPDHPDRRIHLLLSDFGAIQYEIENQTESFFSTQYYCAPEVINGRISCAADQYSLAIMARLLLTDCPLEYPPNTVLTALTTRLHLKEIDDIILQALSPEPEQRFPTIFAFANALEAAIRRQEQPALYNNPIMPLKLSTSIHSSPQAHNFNSIPTEAIGQLAAISAEQTLVSPAIPLDKHANTLPFKELPTSHKTLSLPLFPLKAPLRIQLPCRPNMLTWSPDGSTLVCTFDEAHVAPHLIHANGQSEILNDMRQGHLVCWSPDSQLLAISSYDKPTKQATIRFWSQTAPTERYHALSLYCESPINGLDWSCNEELAVWHERELHIYTRPTATIRQRPLSSSDHHIPLSDMKCGGLSTLRWSPDSLWLTAGAFNGKIALWQRQTNLLQYKQVQPTRRIKSISWSPDSTIIAAALANKKFVQLWDYAGNELAGWHDLPAIPSMVNIAPRTALLTVATWDKNSAAKRTLLFGRIGTNQPSYMHHGQYLASWSTTNRLATLDRDDETTLVLWQYDA